MRRPSRQGPLRYYLFATGCLFVALSSLCFRAQAQNTDPRTSSAPAEMTLLSTANSTEAKTSYDIPRLWYHNRYNEVFRMSDDATRSHKSCRRILNGAVPMLMCCKEVITSDGRIEVDTLFFIRKSGQYKSTSSFDIFAPKTSH